MYKFKKDKESDVKKLDANIKLIKDLPVSDFKSILEKFFR